MVSGISLANKCQLLFGFAIVLIVTGALSVPWFRTTSLVRDSQIEVARQLSDAWLKDRIQLGTLEEPGDSPLKLDEFLTKPDQIPVLRMTLVKVEDIDASDKQQSFLSTSLRQFQDHPDRTQHVGTVRVEGRTVYRFSRPVRESQFRAIRDRAVTEFKGGAFAPDISDPLRRSW